MTRQSHANAEYGTFTDRDRGQLHPVIFEAGDPTDPRNFTPLRKWTIVGSIALIDLTVSWGASGFSPASADLVEYFHADAQAGTLGLSVYVLGLALGPMFLAPLSEYFGRTPLYILPYGTFLLLLAATALSQDLATFFVLRFLSGTFASVTIATFGGTIADLWPRHQVGPAMSLFLWAAVCGSPSGYFAMSFVAANGSWRDVFWALLGVCGAFWLIVVFVLTFGNNETRHAVLLRKRARRLRKEMNDSSIDVPEHAKEKSVKDLFAITLSRPFVFLATEAIVDFAALYNGLLYGISFLFNGAFDDVFGSDGYGFGTMGVGLCFIGFILGVSVGPIVNIWQERYYQHQLRSSDKPPTEIQTNGNSSNEEEEGVRNIPEARVQLGKVAGILLPISLFWFAWTAQHSQTIHWIVPILATALFGFSFYTLILMSYIYVEESFMIFSASALSGVGLVRNLAGAGLPLLEKQLFGNLGIGWGGSVLAFTALLLAPIPFVLERYGTKLRARSPYARQHMDDEDYGRAS